MSYPRYYRTKSTAVMVTLLFVTGVTIMFVVTLRRVAPSPLMWGQWGVIYFVCVCAPGLRAWLTWRKLKPYHPFIPHQAKRVLLEAAAAFVMFGFMALWLMLAVQLR